MHWVWRIVVTAAVLTAAVIAQTSAVADTNGLSCAAGTCTQTFDANGDAPQTFTVPDGVQSISVQAAGAAGDGLGTNGGGETDATLAVTPGEQLTLIVGDQGASATGGYGGGGGGDGNGGGGGTFVSDADSLLIAAGGGGGSADPEDGGPGAGAGQTAGDGGDSGTGTDGTGATSDGVGSGGSVFDSGCSCQLSADDGSGPATATSPGTGGDGRGGGGGGGGYYGGGGGAEGGGGGGSGYADPAASSLLGTVGTNSGPGFVTLSYTQQTQSIVFTSAAPTTAVVGDTYVVSATGGASGNPVTFSIDPLSGPGACSLGSDGMTVSLTAGGSCLIDADQAGDDSYSAAPEQQQQLTVHGRLTTTTVSCSPSSLNDGAPGGTDCRASVSDTDPDGAPIAPAGSVSFLITNPQGSKFTASCPLPASTDGVSSGCSVHYPVPAGSKFRSVKANYNKDLVHRGSAGTTQLTVVPPPVSSTGNSFKTKCSPAAEGQFDPIRFPGQSPAGHMHEFFGNTQIGPSSTGFDLQSASSSSSCADAFDTAAYWAPQLFADGQPVTPTGLDVYYQRVVGLHLASGQACPASANCTGSTFKSVVVPPTDLRLIAGNSAATAPQSISVVKWSCSDNTSRGILPPACTGTRSLVVHVVFPGCWDGGSDLKASGMNNVAYMTINSHGATCPAGYDFPIPKLELTIHYALSPTKPACSSTVLQNCITYALSQFVNGQLIQGSIWTMHADWLNGWQTSSSLGTPDKMSFDQLIARCNNDADGTPACGVVSTKPSGAGFVPFF